MDHILFVCVDFWLNDTKGEKSRCELRIALAASGVLWYVSNFQLILHQGENAGIESLECKLA